MKSNGRDFCHQFEWRFLDEPWRLGDGANVEDKRPDELAALRQFSYFSFNLFQAHKNTIAVRCFRATVLKGRLHAFNFTDFHDGRVARKLGGCLFE